MNLIELDKWFSRFIRLRDSDNGVGRCCSCGKFVNIKKAHCGHYINRKHLSTRFDEHNCHLQCISCNTFDEGNKEGYTLYLQEKYGKDIIQVLILRKNQSQKMSKFEIKALTDHYKNEVKRLQIEKNYNFT